MYALIGKFVIGTIVISTLISWVFHFMNKSEMPDTPMDWLKWSFLPWVMIAFKRDDSDETEK